MRGERLPLRVSARFKEIVLSDPVSPDFGLAVEKTQRAVAALLGGDPEPEKALWSRRDDITLANPAGGYRRGWNEVEAGLDLAASGFAGGRSCSFEEINIAAGADLSYVFELERFESDATEGRAVVSGALRVVMIFRLEDGDWKLVHRQADTLIDPAPQDHAMEEAS
jgi:ketosteroid isomerase-like protein